MMNAFKMSMVILTLKFLIVCTTIGATFGDPSDKEENKTCPKYPYHHCDPKTDAALLHAAIDPREINATTIVSVLLHCNIVQRTEIAEEFEKIHGQSFISKLKDRYPSNSKTAYKYASYDTQSFISLIDIFMKPLHGFYAEELHQAMEGPGTSDDILIEILVPLNDRDINRISRFYRKYYGSKLENDLKSDTSGYFRDFLVSLSRGIKRNKSPTVYVEDAIADAHQLYKAYKILQLEDESIYTAILLKNSIPQLRRTFEEYEKIYNESIEDAIERKFSGSIKDGFLAAVQCTRNKSEYYAKQLHSAIKHERLLGVDQHKLGRVILKHIYNDMDISKVYQKIYGTSIASDFITYWGTYPLYGKYMCFVFALLDQ